MPDAMIASEVSRNPGLEPFRDVMAKLAQDYRTCRRCPRSCELYAANFTKTTQGDVRFYKTPAGRRPSSSCPS